MSHLSYFIGSWFFYVRRRIILLCLLVHYSGYRFSYRSNLALTCFTKQVYQVHQQVDQVHHPVVRQSQSATVCYGVNRYRLHHTSIRNVIAKKALDQYKRQVPQYRSFHSVNSISLLLLQRKMRGNNNCCTPFFFFLAFSIVYCSTDGRRIIISQITPVRQPL